MDKVELISNPKVLPGFEPCLEGIDEVIQELLSQLSCCAKFKSMKCEWDERKNQSNYTKHGFDFADAARIFNSPMVVEFDEREDYGEDRCIGIGLLDGRAVVVVYIELDEETVRIISLRKALSHERRHYEQYLKNRLG